MAGARMAKLRFRRLLGNGIVASVDNIFQFNSIYGEKNNHK